MTFRGNLPWRIASFAVAAGFVLLWQWIADLKLVSPVFLPGPDRAWNALVAGMTEGDLATKLVATVERMIWGWLIASLAGIALGAAIGISPRMRAYVAPMLEFLRPLPASAIIPVAIALLGLSDAMVLFVIAFGALWPVLLATIHGFSAVEPRLYEVGAALGLTRRQTIMKLSLPSASPDILAGMRLGLTVALILAVVCEMLAGRDGLGNWILLSARSFRAPDLYAGVILLGALGFLSSVAIDWTEQRLLRWRARAR
ncbi:ABC transporter permease [Aquamicrobium sp. LC103]|uniref:ABC transporter permease n=1 Tax=Aquamicrobium sp. LC103 TaxID=1120658 RepID=UPI00063EB12C|nr:ABC transporter permease [Aquamicrobium sp. LC103]TKT82561.1 ABC transporter permease [Aquamicrobium sp. LC103]